MDTGNHKDGLCTAQGHPLKWCGLGALDGTPETNSERQPKQKISHPSRAGRLLSEGGSERRA